MNMIRNCHWLITVVAASCAVCNASGAERSFSHSMPEETGERPTNPAREELMRDFKNPFGKVPTCVYWYWMAGNISCEGVRKDLEAMHRAGIDYAYIGDIGGGGNKQGPVRTFSPEWEKAFATAFETASRLGMQIGIFNSPGWSQSGGPWVKPEQAMRRFVSSSLLVDGPKESVVLPAPKYEYAPVEDFRDCLAIAFPVPSGYTERLVARDEKDSLLQVQGKQLVVVLTSSEPFTAQAAELAFADGSIAGKVTVEAEGDSGTWRQIAEMPFGRANPANGVGFSPHAPVLVSFAPVTSRGFRVTVAANEKRYRSRFSSVSICGAPLIARAYEKTLAKMFETPLPMWKDYQWPREPANVPGSALDPAKAVVLRNRIRKDGTLDWRVPAGKWIIYRMASAPTGAKNGPANPEATGYEVDKMNREHVAAHFNAYVGRLLSQTKPEHRKAIRYTVLDSYEMGGQNYTDDFAKRFQASFGYDPVPFLPAVFGMAVGNRSDSDRFLWDLRRFIADEVAYSYVGGLRAVSNAHGMKTWLECYGHWGFPGEFLQYGGQSDRIAGEFWSEGSLGDIENRAASSCGHIYGKRMIWSESNTCGGRPYGRSPADLKQRTDRFFTEGINATLLHLYIHQAYERQPGITAWFGNEFNRHNTWFRQMDIFTGYLKRANYLLQQGLNVADIAYFIGEDVPKMTGVTDPAPPAGRQFDYINGEVLRETAFVDSKGRLALPHGTCYEVLVLPKLETMRPELLRRIEELVQEGAFVLGPKPTRSPSQAGQPQADQAVKTIADRLWGEVDGEKVQYRKVGKGTVAWGLPLDRALALRGSAPDCVFKDGAPLLYTHRTMPNAEIYFLSNQSDKQVSENVQFRVDGRIPELWRATTAEIAVAPNWSKSQGRTEVRVELAPMESVFVVFSLPAGTVFNGHAEPAESRPLKCAWTLSFLSDPLHRGPAQPITVPELFDLSKSDAPAIKYYSGPVVYKTTFLAAKPKNKASHVSLSFGKVCEIARVKVNGRDAGGVWSPPYSVPVTDLLADGENTLEVEVCTSWVNRLIGDASLQEDKRPTWMSTGGYKADQLLRPAGLLGPLSLTITCP